MKIRKYFVLILVFLLTSIGFSSWIIVGSKEEKLGESPVIEPVCYINTNVEGNQYTRIEKALEVAKSGDTVYVVPGTNPIIRKDCEIKSGVSLILPYEGTTWNGRQNGVPEVYSFASHGNFADIESKVGTNLKSNVKLSPKVKLTINGGSLNIGGFIGEKVQVPAGHTSDSYSQITMGLYSDIEVINGGVIRCMGYIKEDYGNITPDTSKGNGSKVNIINGLLYSPFVIYDFRGGSNTAGIFRDSSGTASPFNVFDMPNVQSLIEINYGSTLWGYASLYTDKQQTLGLDAQFNTTDIKVIGSQDSVINLKNGGKAIIKYASLSPLYSESVTKPFNSSSKSVVNLYGGASLGSMNMTVNVPLLNTVNITTTDLLFPVAYKLGINLYDGIFDFDHKIKFMPGSFLNINENATLNVNKECMFYETFTGVTYEAYPSKPAAYALVNGSLFANSGASIGGIIKAGTQDAMLCLGVDSVDNLTVKNKEGTGAFESLQFKFNVVKEQSETARGKIGTSSNADLNFGTSVYLSKTGYWEEVTFNFDISYKIIYDDRAPVDLNIETNPTTGSIKDGATITTNPTVDSSKGEVFTGWFYDKDCNYLITNNKATGANLYKHSTEYNSTTRKVILYALVVTMDPIQINYLDGQNKIFTTIGVYPGVPFATPTNIPTKNSNTSNSDYKIKYPFIEWIYPSEITLNGDGTAILSREFNGTQVSVTSTYDEIYYYKLTVTGTYESCSLGETFGGETYSSSTSVYYVKVGSTISITIKGKYSFFGGTSRTCKITGASWNNEKTDTLTASGGGGLTGAEEKPDSFVMPNNVVTLSTN